MRTITMSDLKAKNVEYWSKKDNSVRGICTVPSEELKVGDEVVISNYFTQIIDDTRTLADVIYDLDTETEVTVWDKDYEVECYWYPSTSDRERDSHEQFMDALASRLTVIDFNETENSAVVNMSDVLGPLAKELGYMDEDDIMQCVEGITSGYQSESWYAKAVEIIDKD